MENTMSDLDQILNNEQPEPTPEAPAPTPEAEAAPVEAVEVTPEPEKAEAPEPAKPEPETVPVGVVAGLRQEIRELKAAMSQPEPTPAPDLFEDPKGFTGHLAAQVQGSMAQMKLEQSRFMAEREFGKDVVDKAFEYFNENPAESQQLLAHPSPFHAAVDHFNTVRVAQEIGSDPSGWQERERERIRAEVEAELVAKQAQEKAAAAAPSMANLTGNGGGPKSNWTGPTALDSVIGN